MESDKEKKENSPKVLLVGGGIGQLHLARKLHDKGIYFIVVAYNIIDEVRLLANKVIKHDLFDLEGVLAIAKEEKVEAVLSDQHDLFIPTVAYVAEHMNLPGNRYEQVITYCDKNKFRTVCDKVGVPVPKHHDVTNSSISLSDYGLSLPVMVKPADSQSSVGVVRIVDESELQPALSNAISLSRSGSAIIEDFFVGQEIVCEGVIQNGNYYNLEFGDRVYFNLPDKFIPSQTIFPSAIPDDLKQRIIECEKRIALFEQPRFAIVHSEYLWNKDTNEIRCVESALRGGGVFISSHLIPACTGIDINDVLIDFALGKQIDVETIVAQKENKAAAYICFYLPQGAVEKIEGISKLKSRSDVIMVCLDNLKVGNKAEKMEHKGNRLGPILIKANSRKELEEAIISIQNELKVLVRTADGLKTQIWE